MKAALSVRPLHTRAILLTIVCKWMFFYHILILHTSTKIEKEGRTAAGTGQSKNEEMRAGKIRKKKEYENKLIWLVQDIIKTCALLSFRLAFLPCKHIRTSRAHHSIILQFLAWRTFCSGSNLRLFIFFELGEVVKVRFSKAKRSETRLF